MKNCVAIDMLKIGKGGLYNFSFAFCKLKSEINKDNTVVSMYYEKPDLYFKPVKTNFSVRGLNPIDPSLYCIPFGPFRPIVDQRPIQEILNESRENQAN